MLNLTGLLKILLIIFVGCQDPDGPRKQCSTRFPMSLRAPIIEKLLSFVL